MIKEKGYEEVVIQLPKDIDVRKRNKIIRSVFHSEHTKSDIEELFRQQDLDVSNIDLSNCVVIIKIKEIKQIDKNTIEVTALCDFDMNRCYAIVEKKLGGK